MLAELIFSILFFRQEVKSFGAEWGPEGIDHDCRRHQSAWAEQVLPDRRTNQVTGGSHPSDARVSVSVVPLISCRVFGNQKVCLRKQWFSCRAALHNRWHTDRIGSNLFRPCHATWRKTKIAVRVNRPTLKRIPNKNCDGTNVKIILVR
jgi:hypothetical protein